MRRHVHRGRARQQRERRARRAGRLQRQLRLLQHHVAGAVQRQRVRQLRRHLQRARVRLEAAVQEQAGEGGGARGPHAAQRQRRVARQVRQQQRRVHRHAAHGRHRRHAAHSQRHRRACQRVRGKRGNGQVHGVPCGRGQHQRSGGQVKLVHLRAAARAFRAAGARPGRHASHREPALHLHRQRKLPRARPVLEHVQPQPHAAGPERVRQRRRAQRQRLRVHLQPQLLERRDARTLRQRCRHRRAAHGGRRHRRIQQLLQRACRQRCGVRRFQHQHRVVSVRHRQLQRCAQPQRAQQRVRRQCAGRRLRRRGRPRLAMRHDHAQREVAERESLVTDAQRPVLLQAAGQLELARLQRAGHVEVEGRRRQAGSHVDASVERHGHRRAVAAHRQARPPQHQARTQVRVAHLHVQPRARGGLRDAERHPCRGAAQRHRRLHAAGDLLPLAQPQRRRVPGALHRHLHLRQRQRAHGPHIRGAHQREARVACLPLHVQPQRRRQLLAASGGRAVASPRGWQRHVQIALQADVRRLVRQMHGEPIDGEPRLQQHAGAVGRTGTRWGGQRRARRAHRPNQRQLARVGHCHHWWRHILHRHGGVQQTAAAAAHTAAGSIRLLLLRRRRLCLRLCLHLSRQRLTSACVNCQLLLLGQLLRRRSDLGRIEVQHVLDGWRAPRHGGQQVEPAAQGDHIRRCMLVLQQVRRVRRSDHEQAALLPEPRAHRGYHLALRPPARRRDVHHILQLLRRRRVSLHHPVQT
mmetsp:Transcript_8948/g.28240  ORF Transcript_8948/g.28240 Transcript_8948/m.28240 type:complete len:752 (+) Transcript_8948:2715-4970(+)